MSAAKKTNPKTDLALVGEVEDPSTPAQNLPATTPTPATLLAMAVQQGADLDKLERLMALQERWEANEARKAFTEAMTLFKSESLAISKNKHVSFQTAKGKTEYDHAELHDVCDVIVPAMAKHGLTHSWTFKQEGARITVGCVITHRLGHASQPVEMASAPDDSGGKNSIQAIASTKTYLERYTLLAATGLATGGSLPGPSTDDDGRGAAAHHDEPERTAQPTTIEVSKKRQAADEARRKAEHDRAWAENSEPMKFIVERLDAGDPKAALAEFLLIDKPTRDLLWLAPTKGGTFTTKQRDQLLKQIEINRREYAASPEAQAIRDAQDTADELAAQTAQRDLLGESRV